MDANVQEPVSGVPSLSQVKMQSLPSRFVDSVALDLDKHIVYAAKSTAGDPLFVTWLGRCNQAGAQLKMLIADLDVIARLRAEGMRVMDESDPGGMRNEAIELIKKAAAYQASDLHLMSRGEGMDTEIQIEVKGGLRVLARKSHAEGEALARSIYQGLATTRETSWNPKEFQNAQISGDKLPSETKLTSVRIIRGPCYPQAADGAFMTLRLQYRSLVDEKENASEKATKLPVLELPRRPEGTFGLKSMGFSDSSIAKLRVMMDSPNGILLFTGPTGSGKTTTIYEILKELARTKPHQRQVSVEDPVEYPMPWAVQLSVDSAGNEAETGAAFAERGRVTLRMAPKTLFYGELRGPKVTVSALLASMTGHKVISSIHVTDPFTFVDRIELMDPIELNRKVFCDHKTVRGVIAQRLLPILCPCCSKPLASEPSAIPERMMEVLKTWGDIDGVRLKGAGCSECRGDGATGRAAVAEVVLTDAALMKDFIEHGSEVARRNFRAKRGSEPSMLECAMGQVFSGKVDPRSVEEHVDLIVRKEEQ